MKFLLPSMLLVALSACSNAPDAPVNAPSTPAQKAAAAEAAEAEPSMDAAQREDVKQALQAEGKACAEVVDVQVREAQHAVDVICIERAGNATRVTHTIDAGVI